MENIVKGLLIGLGAPLALITPAVVAATLGGFAFKAYEEAKARANGRGSNISDDAYFWVAIFLAIGSLSFVWAAIEVFLEII